MMSFERLENYHIVCAENNQRAHCRLKGKSAQSHTVINRTAVDMVSSTKFQRVQITDTLSWSLHTRAVAKRAPEFLYFLRWTRRGHLPSRVLTNFYKSTIESLLTWISVWSGACSAGNPCREGWRQQRRSPSLHFPTSRTLQWNVLWSEQMFHCCFTSPPCSVLPAYIWVKGSAGPTAEQQHLHYPYYRAVTNPHHHHPGPNPQPPKTISDTHIHITLEC